MTIDFIIHFIMIAAAWAIGYIVGCEVQIGKIRREMRRCDEMLSRIDEILSSARLANEELLDVGSVVDET